MAFEEKIPGGRVTAHDISEIARESLLKLIKANEMYIDTANPGIVELPTGEATAVVYSPTADEEASGQANFDSVDITSFAVSTFLRSTSYAGNVVLRLTNVYTTETGLSTDQKTLFCLSIDQTLRDYTLDIYLAGKRNFITVARLATSTSDTLDDDLYMVDLVLHR